MFIIIIVVVVVVVAVFVIITFFFENKRKIANSFSQSYMGIRYILPTLYCLVLYWSLSEVLSYPLNIKRKMGLELPSEILERFNAEKSDTWVSQSCLLRYLSLPSHLYAHSKGQNEEGPWELRWCRKDRRIHKCKIITVENSNVLGKQTNPQCSLFRVILKSQEI